MAKQELEVFSIKVLPLFGTTQSFSDFIEALSFVKAQPETGMRSMTPLVRLEVVVRYTDGTLIEGGFPNKVRAAQFLENRRQGIL